MRERPILFSGPMVRALLAGTKTQTRRVVKHQWPHLWREPHYPTGRVLSDLPRQPGAFMEFRFRQQDEPGYQGSPASTLVPCPYGQPGDRLWVRESWKYADWTEDGEPWIGYAAGGKDALCQAPHEWWDRLENIWVKLSDPDNYDIDGKAADRHWRPSIHMPRWACRLMLEITEVRVERLQDISESDAQAEGPAGHPDGPWHAFRSLWTLINGADSWMANPWVWAVSFKPVPSPAEKGSTSG